MLSRRITQRAFLLRPDRPLVLNILYILGYLQTIYTIDYHTAVSLSNHLHALLTDVLGDQIQPFLRDFFSLLARSTNCFRGRRENLWSSEKPSCVMVAPRAEDVIDKMAYIMVNPVEAGLVSHAKKWPGVKVPAADIDRVELRIRSPRFFYDPQGDMPEEVTVRFTMPKVWDCEPEALRKRLAEECNRREQAVRDRYREEGRKFLGAKRVLRRSVQSAPVTREEWFPLNPHVACKHRGLRARFLAWRKQRERRYRERREAMLEGDAEVVFPEGTYVLHFLAGKPREEWNG